jgi:kumamolisin
MFSNNAVEALHRIAMMRRICLFVVCLAIVSTSRVMAGPQSARVWAASGNARVRAALAASTLLGPQDANATTQLALVLPLRNQAQLKDLLHRLYDPTDPLYGHYLTPQAFAAQFGPTQSDFDAVKQYVVSLGLNVDSESPTRNLLLASGPASLVERSFGVHLNRFRMADGRTVFANDVAPTIPEAVAAKLSGIAGFDNVAIYKPAAKMPMGGLSAVDRATFDAIAPRPQAVGTGPAGGDLELDGYNLSDVTQYFTTFGITPPTLTNVLVNGFTGAAGKDQIEVVLDIDMLTAIAPNIQTIYVYEADNTDANLAAVANKIASDDLAPVVSISWLEAEDFMPAALAASENDTFSEMTAQGQTVCAASGDSGAYGDASTPGITTPTVVVGDPASQPFVLAVGGTTLSTAGPGGAYSGETVWQGTLADAGMNGGGSGGGPSTIWPKPTYQVGDSNLGQLPVGESATMRDVPDVAFDADPNSGEDIFLGGQWFTSGGTSAATPLWAAFLLLADEVRVGQGAPALGFVTPALYSLGRNQTLYPTVFHDVTVGNNLVFDAKVGYDDCTGWGSYMGDPMLLQLAPNRGLLSGTVTDTNDVPISGATVTVVGTSGVSVTATTLADGSYAMVNAPVGAALTATATAPGFVRQSVAGLVLNSTTAVIQNFTLTQAHVYQAGLQMISAPYEYSGIGTFASILGLTHQATDPSLFIWQPFQNGYINTPSAPADTLHLGDAYWVRLNAQIPLQVLGTPASSPFRLVLSAGWNQISDPYLTAMPISSIQVDNLSAGTPTPIASSPQIRLPMFVYDAAINNYNTLGITGTLQPWTGYWIFANQNCVLVMTQPN